ncbi:MAG: glycosyltransferase family 39 protein [Hyphomicrobiaceae bacterium]
MRRHPHAKEDLLSGTSFIGRLMLAFWALHLGLVFLLPDAAARFMLGDRAGDRFHKLSALLQAPDGDAGLRVLFAQGMPGDYVLFAPAFALLGPKGVMVQTLTLYLVALFYLYKLARMLFGETVARIASIAWCLLPATIFHPQAFVSEGICNPLLVIGTYFFVKMARSRPIASSDLLAAVAVFALIAFVRPAYAPLPALLALVLWLFPSERVRRPTREASALAVSGLLLIAGWSLVETSVATRYPAGVSVGGLGSNMFLRAERMAAIGRFELPPGPAARAAAAGTDVRTLLPGEYLAILRAHPGVFLRTAASDAFNLMVNPGMAMVAGRYLRLFDLGEQGVKDLNRWREIRDREGIGALLAAIWQTSPAGFLLNLLGGIAWGCFLLVAVLGAVRLARDRSIVPAARLGLLLTPVYVFALISLVAAYSRWDHRSPMEFVLAILFALGSTALVSRLRRKGAVRPRFVVPAADAGDPATRLTKSLDTGAEALAVAGRAAP